LVFEPILFFDLYRHFALSQKSPQADARDSGQRERRALEQQPDHHVHLPSALAHPAGGQPQPDSRQLAEHKEEDRRRERPNDQFLSVFCAESRTNQQRSPNQADRRQFSGQQVIQQELTAARQ
jgi:hypothetical protein